MRFPPTAIQTLSGVFLLWAITNNNAGIYDGAVLWKLPFAVMVEEHDGGSSFGASLQWMIICTMFDQFFLFSHLSS